MSIVSVSPLNFATNVSINAFIRVVFNTALNRTTVNEYTLILVDTYTQTVIPGRVDYVAGTTTATFQFFDYLSKNTNYTVIVVGGTAGIYALSPNEPFSANNFVFSFTTGESIDYTIPLATRNQYTDGPYFQGADGIYTETFSRTGEPVSHIVTTSASIGPSGTIIPSPSGPDVYIPPSGSTPAGEVFQLVSSDPGNGEENVIASTQENITFTFNGDVASVATFEIEVENILGYDLLNDNDTSNYALSIDGEDYVITPTGSLTEFAPSAIYTVTLSDIVDVGGNEIAEVAISFKTKPVPMYSTVRIIRTNLGDLIATVTDEEIATVIHENSMVAFDNASPAFLIAVPTMAAKNYVTCKSKLDLLERRYMMGGQVERKTLADLTIQYGSGLAGVVLHKINKLEDCIDLNWLELTTGTNHIGPVSAVKSFYDPRYPQNNGVNGGGWTRLANKNFREPRSHHDGS